MSSSLGPTQWAERQNETSKNPCQPGNSLAAKTNLQLDVEEASGSSQWPNTMSQDNFHACTTWEPPLQLKSVNYAADASKNSKTPDASSAAPEKLKDQATVSTACGK